jgi:MFS transporter, OFA family, oxalate/formate antiporter
MKESNYRWVIFGACFLIFFALVGVANAPFSLYIVPVTEYFGFSRGDFTLVFTIKTVIGVIIQLSFGVILKKLGLRWVVVFGSILIPVGFFIFGQAENLSMFYLGGFFAGLGFSLASITPITLLIDQWFHKGEGLILGLISAGSGFGGALFTRIIGAQIIENGFQSAFQFSAIILAVTALPVILLIRARPEAKATAIQNNLVTGNLQSETQADALRGFRQVMKQRPYWLALGAVFLIGMAIFPVILSTPPYLIEKGFGAVFSASVIGGIFLVLAFAKILLGFLHDRLGIRTSLMIGVGSFVISTVVLILAARPWMVWAYALFSGTGAATLAVLIPMFAREVLGQENFHNLLGVFIAVVSAGIGIGTPLINYVYDLSGSYTLMIAINGLVGLMVLFIVHFALEKKRRARYHCQKPLKPDVDYQ